MDKSKINVLAVFANPANTHPLRLAREERIIREAIKRSTYRGKFNIIPCPAATIHDLSRALLENTVQVVHISGHGSNRGLVLENEAGGLYLVDQPTLAELFHRYCATLQCVVLNACYSFNQGQLISMGIPFTIAMEGSIDDDAAIEFSRGFYDALGAGKSIETAFSEGCTRMGFAEPKARRPLLLKQGEQLNIKSEEERIEAGGLVERLPLKTGKFLIGLAVDLSGSMEQSIGDRSGKYASRIESVQQSFSDFMRAVRDGIKESRTRGIQTDVDMFIYGFGLRSIPVCDLLSLLKVSREVITEEVIEVFKEQYKQEKQDRYKGFAGTGALLRRSGLDGVMRIVEDITRRQSEIVIRRRVLNEMRGLLEERMQQIGNTTLPLEEVTQIWSDGGSKMLLSAKELLFGDTPVCEVLSTIVTRIEQEMQERDKDTRLILFLVSDGKYSADDPMPLGKQLKDMGVTIVSCFISDQDCTHQRALLNAPEPQWQPEAKLMFEMASTISNDVEVGDILLRHNWIIYPNAKLFVQLNRSDILEEFFQGAIGLLEEPQTVQVPSKGW